MFGLELWFVLAVLSAIGGGLYIFATKVASERDYDVILLSATAVIIAGLLQSVIVIIRGDYSGATPIVLAVVVGNGVAYMAVNVLRHYAQQCIDVAIYYPIYKTLTPALAILVGYLFLTERFTATEGFGLLLSLLVPLLLISRFEKTRQKDLWRGLRLLVFTAVLAVFASFIIKIGVETTENVWLYTMLTEWGIAASGVCWMLIRARRKSVAERLQSFKNPAFVWLALWLGVTATLSFVPLVFAFKYGTLSVVYTINSLYIIIPIVLSIIYYHEHWNARKVAAIILSIAALMFLQ